MPFILQPNTKLSFSLNNCEKHHNESGCEVNSRINENCYSQEELLRNIRAILIGMIGKGLTFVVMQRGSLRNVSTCFYMALLAVVDTGGFLFCTP